MCMHFQVVLGGVQAVQQLQGAVCQRAVLFSCEECNLWKIYLQAGGLSYQVTDQVQGEQAGAECVSWSISGSEIRTGA